MELAFRVLEDKNYLLGLIISQSFFLPGFLHSCSFPSLWPLGSLVIKQLF